MRFDHCAHTYDDHAGPQRAFAERVFTFLQPLTEKKLVELGAAPEAVLSDDWATIAMMMPSIAQKFSKIEVSDNHRLGKPWSSAYKLLALHQKL